ncbi:MAG: ATP-binding protein, partial [Gemmataceae bacterium]|nr:ATP-binding protein [Gemmataceae bacterium]
MSEPFWEKNHEHSESTAPAEPLQWSDDLSSPMRFAPLAALLRETLERLQAQEQRTAALEAAVRDAQPTGVAPRSVPAPAPPTLTVGPVETDRTPPPLASPSQPPTQTPSSALLSPASIVASLDDVVWSISLDGEVVLFIGGGVERLYGVPPAHWQAAPGRWLAAIPPEDRERWRAVLARLPETERFRLEHRVAYAGGGYRWVISRGKLIRDRDGRPLRIDGISSDSLALSRSRPVVLDLLQALGSATGSEFLTRWVTAFATAYAVATVWIVEAHATGTRTVAAVIAGENRNDFPVPANSRLVADLLAGGRAFAPTAARERYPADPLLLPLQAEALAAEPLLDAQGQVLGFVAVADGRAFVADHDLRSLLKAFTPRLAAELARGRHDAELHQRLSQAEQQLHEKDAVLRNIAPQVALARVAAGLAHDSNNLLSVVTGTADLLRDSLDENDPRRESAELIARTAQTLGDMNRQLLEWGRPRPPSVAPLDVTHAIQTLEPLLRRLLDPSMQLQLDLAPNLPLIAVDAIQFDRVILNLVLNARDAIYAKDPPGDRTATITLRTAQIRIETPPPDAAHRALPLRPGGYVVLTVTDTGCGMTAEVRSQMFETYFTTKGSGGHGLGLAMVKEAVTAAGGAIDVESQPGWGTQVRIYWPVMGHRSAWRI